MNNAADTPTRVVAPAPVARKTDLFATFALALTLGAVAAQVVLVIWLGSR